MDSMRGTTMGQDSRFKDKEAASIKATKFPKNFNEKVDLRKVNLSVLRGWIAQKVTELIRIEDDVVVEYVFGMLEDKDNPMPDPRKMQVSLVGFMNKYGAAAFMEALWTLLLSAQNTVGGVPAEFIAAKKAELEQRQMNERNGQDASRPPPRDGRGQASDSFDRRDNRLPPRPDTHDYRKGPPPRRFDDRNERGPYGRDRGDRGYDNRQRDSGYGGRFGGSGRDGPDGGEERSDRYGNRGDDRPPPTRRSRSRSPPRYRRRSPSPPPRRRTPSPAPRESANRQRSITPPLRSQKGSDVRAGYEDRRPERPDRGRASPSPSPPRPTRTERQRGRPRSVTPRSVSRSRSRSRSRSPTVTPPRRGRRDSTPPVKSKGRGYDNVSSRSPEPKRRRRSPSDSRSPPPARRRRSSTPPAPRRQRSPSPQATRDRETVRGNDGPEEDVIKKGRGRFTVEDEEARGHKKKLEGRLAQSKWAQDD
ncbi:hypothetical protein BD324DRAFT_614315 [Kockovaella imperatae]|uniref:PWI domain-containing protein n=1 Tax=Kockovaella imperatae TaxID=4999 RepID=A0A1Y1UQ75_9TREE|nr:hypothetical protein BD324DRAFT_614315 [Kockovaella imperatae]ORX39606.1 hypothetical protein BD324DRAFT_614315 [Kockovaella imperatae]